MTANVVDAIGLIGAALSTLCGVPQVLKIVREKETRAISLVSTLGLVICGLFWLTYGIARLDWPLMTSSFVSLALTLVILGCKLRYG
jgi:MtN3 and saliva related transmembrane protein